MDTKHTPGPWRWWACKEGGKHDYVQIAAGKEHVAQVRILSVTEEDLRLIAAAPELLAALDATLERVKFYADDLEDDDTFQSARKVIAKATGAAA